MRLTGRSISHFQSTSARCGAVAGVAGGCSCWGTAGGGLSFTYCWASCWLLIRLDSCCCNTLASPSWPVKQDNATMSHADRVAAVSQGLAVLTGIHTPNSSNFGVMRLEILSCMVYFTQYATKVMPPTRAGFVRHSHADRAFNLCMNNVSNAYTCAA